MHAVPVAGLGAHLHPKLKNVAVVGPELDVDDDGQAFALPKHFKGITEKEGKAPTEARLGIARMPENVAFFRQLKFAAAGNTEKRLKKSL